MKYNIEDLKKEAQNKVYDKDFVIVTMENDNLFFIVDSWGSMEEIEKWVVDKQNEIVENTSNEEYQELELFNDLNDFSDVLGFVFDNVDSMDCWGFDDEYATCDECGKLLRTSPDCWAWTPDYILTECGRYCEKCVNESPEGFVDMYVNAEKLNTVITEDNLELLGFSKVEQTYENGLYSHMMNNKTPAQVIEGYMKEDLDIEIVFNKVCVSQFHTEWEVYKRLKQ